MIAGELNNCKLKHSLIEKDDKVIFATSLMGKGVVAIGKVLEEENEQYKILLEEYPEDYWINGGNKNSKTQDIRKVLKKNVIKLDEYYEYFWADKINLNETILIGKQIVYNKKEKGVNNLKLGVIKKLTPKMIILNNEEKIKRKDALILILKSTLRYL